MTRFDWRLGLKLVCVASILVTSCGGAPLSLDQWQPRWNALTESINDLESSPITHTECQGTLAFLREQKPELTPPPLEDLEVPVASWFNQAEDIFFECDFDDIGRRSFDTLRALEDEVEAVLALEA